MPELLRRIWKVQRATLFQVGNLGGDKSLWEVRRPSTLVLSLSLLALPADPNRLPSQGPIFQGGKIKEWIVGGLPDRLFPIDMGGFSINSSVIGDGRPVHPPRYIPANDFGGERCARSRLPRTESESCLTLDDCPQRVPGSDHEESGRDRAALSRQRDRKGELPCKETTARA